MNLLLFWRQLVEPKKPKIRQLSPLPAKSLNFLGSSNLIGPLNEDSRVILECESEGGLPAPQLIWLRDNLLVDDSFEQLTSDGRLLNDFQSGHSNALNRPLEDFLEQAFEFEQPTTRSEFAISSQSVISRNRLELSGLTRADLLANYTCLALNNKLTKQAPSSFALIDLNCK